MGPEDIATLLVGAFAGAACSFLNTVASSGSAVSLPILMAVGLSPLMANATNRVPVLIGAMAAAVQFWRKGHIEIPLALKVCLPVTLGAVLGTLYAEALPSRDMGLIITASVMTALLLLFTKVKSALETIQALPTQFGIREFVLLFAIGAWLGFIVLDGATYLLMALVLSAHVPLVQANALKNVALVPTTLVALIFFALDGAVDWGVGATMGVGGIAGGVLGAVVSTHATAKKWVFRMLVLVISFELVHLAVHYVFHTA